MGGWVGVGVRTAYQAKVLRTCSSLLKSVFLTPPRLLLEHNHFSILLSSKSVSLACQTSYKNLRIIITGLCVFEGWFICAAIGVSFFNN